MGINIRNKRKSLNLSQEYIAEQLQVSRQAVSKWEMGQSEPSTNNLIKLAELFSCDITEILSQEQTDERKVIDNQMKQETKTVIEPKNWYFSSVHLILTIILFSNSFTSYENAVFKTVGFLLIVNISCFCSEYLVIKYYQMNQQKNFKKGYVLFIGYQTFITVILFVIAKFLF
ncbi:helix-turn-helix domain-containing protein [Oceanobacillus jeddahense]|uniref:helix-turn-helix domain-containing protein n=1 Tax=Oceanobacillus jeddahense TaxID=1462527 RepID=UPI003644D824